MARTVVEHAEVLVTSDPKKYPAGDKEVIKFEGRLRGKDQDGETVEVEARFTIWPDYETNEMPDYCSNMVEGDTAHGYAKQDKPWNDKEQWMVNPDRIVKEEAEGGALERGEKW